jgi:deoxyribodipyrimidine photo-lyase
LRTLKILQQDLAHLDIPLLIEVIESRKGIPAKIVQFMKEWKVSDLFANIEYEIDELDRDTRLIAEAEASQLRIIFCHDQCVVEPGEILTGVCSID